MSQDPTKATYGERAVFPLWDATPATVRDFVTNTLAAAASTGGVPIWTLPEPKSATARELRLRRMALLFLLGLPGEVVLDIDAERILQQERQDTPYSVDEIIQRALDRRVHRGPVTSVSALRDRDAGGRLNSPGYVVMRAPGSGELNVANLSSEPLPLPDGTIVLASDDPAGPFDPTSDNDMLPGLTTIWFAPK